MYCTSVDPVFCCSDVGVRYFKGEGSGAKRVKTEDDTSKINWQEELAKGQVKRFDPFMIQRSNSEEHY